MADIKRRGARRRMVWSSWTNFLGVLSQLAPFRRVPRDLFNKSVFLDHPNVGSIATPFQRLRFLTLLSYLSPPSGAGGVCDPICRHQVWCFYLFSKWVAHFSVAVIDKQFCFSIVWLLRDTHIEWADSYKGTSLTCHPRFPWNFQDCKIAVPIWEDTQAPNLLPKFTFTTVFLLM